MQKEDKIFVAGHRGMVGSAIIRKLKSLGYLNLLLRTSQELDLRNQFEVSHFFNQEKPDYVFLAAAKVGGILANNTSRAEFLYDNLMIQSNVIHHSYLNHVKKLLFLGSTCIYPKNCPQPMAESSLLTSELEYTNEPYAIAKINGIKMCESYNLQYGTNFISVMPTNLYGPGDNFNLKTSHVLPALMKKIHLAKLLSKNNWDAILKQLKSDSIEQAKQVLSDFGISKEQVEIWGTGKPRREFLHSDDMADASVYLMEQIDFKDLITDDKEVKNTHINIGTGKDISIKELAEIIQQIIGYDGGLFFNSEMPDGTMVKRTDISKLTDLGWQANISFRKGLEKFYLESVLN